MIPGGLLTHGAHVYPNREGPGWRTHTCWRPPTGGMQILPRGCAGAGFWRT
jgi:hypothetical protein